MDRFVKIGFPVLCAIVVLLTSGCPQPPPGFKVTVNEVVSMPGIQPFPIPLSGIFVTGRWQSDLSGANGNTINFSNYTNFNGWFTVSDGRMPAVWTSGIIDPNTPPVCSPNVQDFNVTTEHPSIDWICPHIVDGASPTFSISSSLPPTLNISASGYSSGNGMPYINLYGPDGSFVSSDLASAVSADGTSATFPFPTKSGGGSLGAGLYTFNVWNPGPYTQPRYLGGGFFSLGSTNASLAAPYGVEAVDFGRQTLSNGVVTSRTYQPAALVTLANQSEMEILPGTAVTVGSQPIAVKSYLYTSQDYISCNRYGTCGGTIYTFPSRAIVANFASNTVSILSLTFNTSGSGSGQLLTTLNVGAEPSAITLSSDQKTAYVANFGSSSVSVVDLSENVVTGAIAVGSQPAALALDPSGSSLWVGGNNYIDQVDLTNSSVLSSLSVSGQVTSLAVSAGQNVLVYTTISTSGGSTTFQAQQAAISGGAVQETYAQYTLSSNSTYAEISTQGGPAPGTPGWLMSSGALVSANYGNGAAIVGTPTGFVVLDLVAKSQIMQGTTPSAVHGIASDPSQGIVYLTVPESNSLITVPLPPPQ